MERMTRRDSSGFAMLNREYTPTEVWDRLAAYEDVELTPEEIEAREDVALWISEERFDEIIRAEAENRLIILPCKVGDMVFRIEYVFDENNSVGYMIGVAEREFSLLLLDEFGKTVFLTREEAEAVLAAEGVLAKERHNG